MARKSRLDVPGACYHVFARGNRRAAIFHDDPDYCAYLDRMERYRQCDGLTVHAYVLMPNHLHLLLETGERPLSRTMHVLQSTYSQYYNRRYGKAGHVFQGRYQGILCDREAYLLELVRYLHLNPARMRTPLNPWTYSWSSHAAYLGRRGSVVVSASAVPESFHRQVGPAQQAYHRFMFDGLAQGHQERLYETVEPHILGDERFLETVSCRIAPCTDSVCPSTACGVRTVAQRGGKGLCGHAACDPGPRPSTGTRSRPCHAGVSRSRVKRPDDLRSGVTAPAGPLDDQPARWRLCHTSRYEG